MQRRKSFREVFEENYYAVKVEKGGRKGNKIGYVYSGPCYFWDLQEKQLKKEKKLLLSISLIGIFLMIFSGAQAVKANTDRFVAILSLLALSIHILELCAVLKFFFSKNKVTRMVWKEVDFVLGSLVLVRAILQLAVCVVSVWYAGINYRESIGWLTAVCYGLCCGLAFFISKRYRRIGFYTEKNESCNQD